MKTDNDTWANLLGFTPNAEMKRMVLNEMKAAGLTLVQACARHSFPGPLVLMRKGRETFTFEGKEYTPASWEAEHPSRTLVIVR